MARSTKTAAETTGTWTDEAPLNPGYYWAKSTDRVLVQVYEGAKGPRAREAFGGRDEKLGSFQGWQWWSEAIVPPTLPEAAATDSHADTEPSSDSAADMSNSSLA
ncbi:hypothetical protein H6F43_03105 [Leptolyngbya sp. FACHB-36]|uniref:hypothetical protein n=1 Tax=Leptolyngbya sp. FACHB-36 TaxID=2692808 RepID=UPI0016813176|nr:hypothetical protein [Leptolyngbya sp. FACHB-36]MBD2019172.1 hypothetical protein [Leptolyngbya sp. FACHB-36]